MKIKLKNKNKDKAKDTNKKDEDEGNKMIEEFEKHYKELEQKIKNDLSLLTEWKQEAQLYCLLKLYMEFYDQVKLLIV